MAPPDYSSSQEMDDRPTISTFRQYRYVIRHPSFEGLFEVAQPSCHWALKAVKLLYVDMRLSSDKATALDLPPT